MMDDELPEGWVEVPLNDLLQPGGIFDGPFGSHLKTSDYTESGIRVLRLENLANLRFVEEKRTFISRPKYETLRRHTVVAGDILFGSFVDSHVRVCLLPALKTPAIAKADCFCIRTIKESVDRRFLVYQLGTRATRDALLEEIHGVTRPRITTKQLRALTVAVAPLIEQRRIVAMIDATLAKVSAASQRLARIPLILKRFRQSVLAAACSGKLTEDWRQRDVQDELMTVESSLPDSWSRATLGELTTLVTSGSRGWAQHYSDEGPLFIRAQDINTDALVLDEVAHVRPPRGAEGLRTRVVLGDLLVTITGANVTRTAWVDRSIGEAYVSQHVGLVRPSDRSVTPFLHAWLCSPAHGRAALLEAAYGAGKPGLNLENLRSLEVVMPPVEERTLILKRMLELLALADAIERRITVASARADVLTQSILGKAFRGELVPTEAELARADGRDYESGEALLARIRAERAAIAPPSTGQRGGALRAGARS